MLFVHFQGNTLDTLLVIRDISGKQLAQEVMIGEQHRFNSFSLTSGVYVLEFRNNEINQTLKFIK